MDSVYRTMDSDLRLHDLLAILESGMEDDETGDVTHYDSMLEHEYYITDSNMNAFAASKILCHRSDILPISRKESRYSELKNYHLDEVCLLLKYPKEELKEYMDSDELKRFIEDNGLASFSTDNWHHAEHFSGKDSKDKIYLGKSFNLDDGTLSYEKLKSGMDTIIACNRKINGIKIKYK